MGGRGDGHQRVPAPRRSHFHTYSCFQRGIDLLNGTYNWLDLTAHGRQEDWEQPPRPGQQPALSWVRRPDEYAPRPS